MSAFIDVVIRFDQRTGQIQLKGPVENTMLMHGLLGCAARIVDRVADDRDRAQTNGHATKILIPQFQPPKGL